MQFHPAAGFAGGRLICEKKGGREEGKGKGRGMGFWMFGRDFVVGFSPLPFPFPFLAAGFAGGKQ